MKHLPLIAFLFTTLPSFAQQINAEKVSTQDESVVYNKKDKYGKRMGMWIIQEDAEKGEPAKTSMGTFIDGRKNGTWYELDFEGKPISICKYLKGVLNGESKYFENGKLVCIGNWRGLNPDEKLDTIWVYDPKKGYEEQVVIPTERGTLQHGIWKYYHPDNGLLIKEEEYQVGELIKVKDYKPTSTLSDEIRKQLDEQHQKHLKNKPYIPHKVKRNKI
jgi:antitoxin component YwqK of YwqJK toxin-antitoxin module